MKKTILPYLFVLPLIIILFFVTAFPIFRVLQLSFFNWPGYGKQVFVWFSNFKTLISDQILLHTLKNTALFTFFNVLGTVSVGFVLAAVINLQIKGWKVYKIIFFLPLMYSAVVVGTLWSRIFEPTFGILNNFLDLIHLSGFKQMWLADPKLALWCIDFVSIWQNIGFPMIFFLAGMENIDVEIYESAEIDGVGVLKQIFYITIPLIKNVFAVLIMLQTIYAFRIFGIVWVMTMGGPGNASQVLGTYIYKTGFIFSDNGYGATLSLLAFMIAIILGLIYLRAVNSEKEEID